MPPATGNGLRVPHVGWNELHQVRESPLFAGIEDGALFYYVHSYDLVAGDAELVPGGSARYHLASFCQRVEPAVPSR